MKHPDTLIPISDLPAVLAGPADDSIERIIEWQKAVVAALRNEQLKFFRKGSRVRYTDDDAGIGSTSYSSLMSWLENILENQTAASRVKLKFSEVERADADAPVARALVERGLDWKQRAREIADECFDRDSNGTPPTRDSLIRLNSRNEAIGGYAVRVMEIMQERGIHGPRGLIVNAKTISREALQGDKWWGRKSK